MSFLLIFTISVHCKEAQLYQRKLDLIANYIYFERILKLLYQDFKRENANPALTGLESRDRDSTFILSRSVFEPYNFDFNFAFSARS